MAAACALSLALGGTAYAVHLTPDTAGLSTLEHTICVPPNPATPPNPPTGCRDPNTGYKELAFTEGEPHVVRTLAGVAADPDRTNVRRSLAYLGQITDFQLADEESPSREERFDGEPLRRASDSGYRPQEPFVVHSIEESIRQMNNFLQSPVQQGDGSRATLENAVMTGDLAENMHKNETEWVRTLLEGGPLNPGSGTQNLTGTKCAGVPPQLRETLIADFDDPSRYTGVMDYEDYANDNPIYYDPETPQGIYAERNWPSFPDDPVTGESVLDAAQVPFQAEGLAKGVESYVAFGNHDALYQGAAQVAPGILVPPGDVTYEDPADDCLKPVYPVTDKDSAFEPNDLDELLAGVATGKVMMVPPDPNRRFVDHPQFKAIFEAGAQEDDHGFAYVDDTTADGTPNEEADSNGHAAYYAFSPKPGIRYVVLDTVADAGVPAVPSGTGDPDDPASFFVGGDDGNINHPQFVWLENELEKAEKNDELVIAFGHHGIGDLRVPNPDEVAPCTGVQDEHPPVGGRKHDKNPSCDLDPRPSTPLHFGPDLRDLFLEHPNVIAYVAGHAHENLVSGFSSGDGRSGFWELKSPAIADWPPQNRMIEVMDNRDGTLSIFGTMTDHQAPLDSPDSGAVLSPDSGAVLSEAELGTLASLGRTLTYNDPQLGCEAKEQQPCTDPAHEIGQARDRNVELLLPDPRGSVQPPPPPDPGGGQSTNPGVGQGGKVRCRSRIATVVGTSSGETITGTAERDVIAAGAGNDTVLGYQGKDLICGGGGKDKLVGGKGRDLLIGGPRDDLLRGGRGRDRGKGKGGDDECRSIFKRSSCS